VRVLLLMVLIQLIVYTLILKTLKAFHKFFDKEGLISDKIRLHSPSGVVAPPGASPVAT